LSTARAVSTRTEAPSRSTRRKQRAPRRATARGGRPGAGTDDGSRERIQASALDLFCRYGYEGVSLQMIADDVGLHKSSLFHHYRGKLELLDDAADAVVEWLLALLSPLLAEETPSLETLFGAIDLLVDHLSEHPHSARLLVMIMTAPHDSDVRKLGSSERSLHFYVDFARWLERARRASVIRRLSIRQAIPNLMGLVLFYPAVASDLGELVGVDAFGPRARQIRKQELRRLLTAMFAPE
jgi:AcrR family transcriptional regulator